MSFKRSRDERTSGGTVPAKTLDKRKDLDKQIRLRRGKRRKYEEQGDVATKGWRYGW